MTTSARLSAAFVVSVALHAALVIALRAVPAPERKPAPRAHGGGLFVRVCEWERPARRAPVPSVAREHYIPVGVEPGVGAAPAVSEIGDGGPAKGGPSVPSAGGLLAAPGSVRRVVYLVDRSGSMGLSGGLGRARRELREALAGLPPDAWFQVLFYNQGVQPLLPAGAAGLLRADPATVGQALARLDEFPASGGTNHPAALQAALYLRPEVLFLVTDADDLADRQVQAVTRLNAGRVKLHVVEMSRVRTANPALAGLARLNAGSHRLVPPTP